MSDDASLPLAARRCKPSASGVARLSATQIQQLLPQLDGWTWRDEALVKTFHFPDYAHTMVFVNAAAWIAQHEDHHPDLHVGYGSVRVEYGTHAVGGVSENDFICAAKLDAFVRH